MIDILSRVKKQRVGGNKRSFCITLFLSRILLTPLGVACSRILVNFFLYN